MVWVTSLKRYNVVGWPFQGVLPKSRSGGASVLASRDFLGKMRLVSSLAPPEELRK
jgi:hypothetical protein